MTFFKSASSKISLVWVSVAVYFVATAILVVFKSPEMVISKKIILNRLVFAGAFLVLYLLHGKIQYRLWSVFSVVLVYALLTILYKETAVLNPLFLPSLDEKLSHWDMQIFGFQPSLKFSDQIPYSFFSEMMYFGYFSYYLMPLIILFLIYRFLPSKIEEFGFVVITSFLMYYLVFILFQAVGPQFYFGFPENYSEAKGVFGSLIKIIQENGEAKTAAFPSSHVGVALIMLIWMYKNLKRYWLYFIPTVLLLIFATVYIKAHYAVDVFAGFISAPVVYFLSNFIFMKISIKNVHTYTRS